MVEYFATLQRLYSTGCKTGHRDLLMGAAATAAEYNGVEASRHIHSKMTDLFLQSEKSFGCALAAVYTGQQMPSGVFVPDVLYANIAKLQGVDAIWQGNTIAADIVGGLVCTLPAASDLTDEKIGPLLDKYLKGKVDVPTESRIRIMRLVEYLIGQGSVVPIKSTHGDGSPEAQRMVIQQALLKRLEGFKQDAKAMAGIR